MTATKKVVLLAVGILTAAAAIGIAVYFRQHRMNPLESGEIYIAEGHASKLEYPLKETSLQRIDDKFHYLYENYLQGKNLKIYFAAIPDKNYFLAEKNQYHAMDYQKLQQEMKDRLEFAEQIDLFDCLKLEDYYLTDSHWRQECLEPVVQRLSEAMDFTPVPFESYEKKLAGLLRGAYLREGGLEMDPDAMYYLTNEMLENCTVYHYVDESETGIYVPEKLEETDAYGFFLSGTDPLLTIENPAAPNDRELVIFRDSFGSSLAPLLAGSYRKVTLVDIRFVRSDYLGNFLEITDQEVLFLYSTLIINNSSMLR